MKSHTFRQYEVWVAYMDDQWNRPNRGDHYLMQIAAEVRRSYATKPNQVKDSKFKIEFEAKTKEKPKPMTDQQKAAANAVAKARWLGIVGVTNPTPTGPKAR
jgi:hypothetical protein